MALMNVVTAILLIQILVIVFQNYVDAGCRTGYIAYLHIVGWRDPWDPTDTRADPPSERLPPVLARPATDSRLLSRRKSCGLLAIEIPLRLL